MNNVSFLKRSAPKWVHVLANFAFYTIRFACTCNIPQLPECLYFAFWWPVRAFKYLGWVVNHFEGESGWEWFKMSLVNGQYDYYTVFNRLYNRLNTIRNDNWDDFRFNNWRLSTSWEINQMIWNWDNQVFIKTEISKKGSALPRIQGD